MDKFDGLVVQVARLKERVKVLEQAVFSPPSEYIEGWAAVAGFLGISDQTCVGRYKRGEFPTPCAELTFERAGRSYSKPRWRRIDLVAYAEGKWHR